MGVDGARADGMWQSGFAIGVDCVVRVRLDGGWIGVGGGWWDGIFYKDSIKYWRNARYFEKN